jgi:MarR family transcriptional regulator, transcriptional regulator for hemolysin
MNKSTYLPRDFTSELVIAGRLWRRMTRVVSAAHGVAEAGATPLLWIERLGEGVRQNVLAERIGIESPSLVRVLDDLAGSGLIRREPDPSDRRANLLFLTEHGREIAMRMEVEIEDLRTRVLGDLGEADISGAARVFAAIKAAAGTLPAAILESAD